MATERSLILAGSDKTTEKALPNFAVSALLPVAGLRFALATKWQLQDTVTSKLSSSEPLRVGTEYPVTLQNTLGTVAANPIVWSGKSEGMIDYFGPEAIDTVFCLVKSGKTLVDNDLVIIEDDIALVMLCAIAAVESTINCRQVSYNGA